MPPFFCSLDPRIVAPFLIPYLIIFFFLYIADYMHILDCFAFLFFSELKTTDPENSEKKKIKSEFKTTDPENSEGESVVFNSAVFNSVFFESWVCSLQVSLLLRIQRRTKKKRLQTLPHRSFPIFFFSLTNECL